MPFKFGILSKCSGCRKRKLFVSNKWIKPKFMPKIRPKELQCNKCLSIYQKLK